jgi:hypothetical protein
MDLLLQMQALGVPPRGAHLAVLASDPGVPNHDHFFRTESRDSCRERERFRIESMYALDDPHGG